MVEKQFINTKEAAEFLNMSRSHLYLLTRRGVIPSHRPTGEKIYYSLSELEKWITKK